VGIYDRDYYRQEPSPGFSLRAPHTAIGAIIAINAAIWLVDGFFMPETLRGGRLLSDWMAVRVDTLTHPWLWWEYLTAGFAHSPDGVSHILGNMLVLFFLGRDIEGRYGRQEFLRLYLVILVFANVVWTVVNKLTGTPVYVQAYGASGAITGIVILYALNFPNRTLLLYFVIPIPAWVLGLLFVAYDMFGASGGVAGSNVAYSIHLAGAAFAFVYFQQGWNFGRLLPGRIKWPSFRRKPKLRIHRPEEPEKKPSSDLSTEVDRILEKIYRDGEASLSAQERKTLETASREYQRRNKG
jgi:membrane associated rhomboid family serine protease